MIISQQDPLIQFICKNCFQYANKLRKCLICDTVYCYDCIKEKRRSYEKNEQFYYRKCECRLEWCNSLNCVEQYVHDQLKIKCRICDEVKSVKNIKLHEAKCHYKEQEALKQLQQPLRFPKKQTHIQNYPTCCSCKQIQFDQKVVIQKYDLSIICKKCLNIEVNLNQKYMIEMSEEQINGLWTNLFQCFRCRVIGDYLQIQSHYFVCNQQFVDCNCGWLGRRKDFLNHFYECAIDQLKTRKMELNQVIQVEDWALFNFEKLQQEYSLVYQKNDELRYVNGFADFLMFESTLYIMEEQTNN